MNDSITNEQYIEHEVKIRIHDEKFNRMESKLNWLLTLAIGSILMPIIIHHYGF